MNPARRQAILTKLASWFAGGTGPVTRGLNSFSNAIKGPAEGKPFRSYTGTAPMPTRQQGVPTMPGSPSAGLGFAAPAAGLLNARNARGLAQSGIASY